MSEAMNEDLKQLRKNSDLNKQIVGIICMLIGLPAFLLFLGVFLFLLAVIFT